ncbi:FAD-binding oxidoreductase [Streptomyces bacillaris]|uniref:FAD-binding oxidoreductase n=1 Tax=Streptomyces bacillaris TaxID=68179 RepID=UPI0037FDA8A0
MFNRRRFLAGTGAAVATSGAVAALGTPAAAAGPAAAPAVQGAPRGTRIATVTPADPRYADMVSGTNARLVGTPEAIRVPANTREVIEVVREAVRDRKQIVIRSGGHCFEDLVFNQEAEILVDLRLINQVGYDDRRKAFFVDPGATLLDIYETLHSGWGVTVPGGGCHSVGAGGHFAGGGYGVLSRKHGIVSDHLYAVEVVTVDRHGNVRAVIATREQNDPNRDLLWAFAGGGGGNFGVVTRYWLRTRGATGAPENLLPQPPSMVYYVEIAWPWEKITEASFKRLLKKYTEWSRKHSGADSPYAALGHWLFIQHQSSGPILLVGQMDATVPNARKLLDDFIGHLSAAMGTEPVWNGIQHLPFMKATTYGTTAGEPLNNPNMRTMHKSAFMRGDFPDRQIDVLYKQLVRPDYTNQYTYVVLHSTGGQINELRENETAAAHRDSHLVIFYECYWHKPEDDEKNLGWMRETYREVYADTGGVPVPNRVTDGCYINYPDRDLSDPEWNTSSVPWHDLYYRGNYARLQQIKAKWDPTDFFRHRHSVRLPKKR